MAEQLSCQEVVEVATDYLERALPPDDATLFEQHISVCDSCKWYLDQMRITLATIGRVGRRSSHRRAGTCT
jgi:putative zinc finger protein